MEYHQGNYIDTNPNTTTPTNSSPIASEYQLIQTETNAVKSFLDVVNNVIRKSDGLNAMSEKTALKFLISRKFDVQRALQLYQLHEITRLREDLTNIDPNEPDIQLELQSQKFTILKTRDPNNSAIALFTAKLHKPFKQSKDVGSKKSVHKTTLKGIVYQLDAALEDVITQRNGVIFIYDMSDSDYSHFDYELCQKILNLLKGAYPAKLKKVLIVSPPLWFRAPFHLLRLIVREKLRDRVWLLNREQLLEHVIINSLTVYLGGRYEHDHESWIQECNNIHKNRINDLCDLISAQNLTKLKSSRSNSKLYHDVYSGIDSAVDQDYKFNEQNDDKGITAIAENNGLSLSQFIEKLRADGETGLVSEYKYIVEGEQIHHYTFHVSRSSENHGKNRYANILCYDHTRVILLPYDLPETNDTSDLRNYINANYVDGFRQPRAYISTQGPNSQTIGDFWRMMWQTGSRVIVMVTLIFENDMLKCDSYWPTQAHRSFSLGLYTVEFVSIEHLEDFVITQIRLTNTKLDISRDIWHMQFTSWPDFGTPNKATALLNFRDNVLKKQLTAIEQSGRTYPPIVVHCSAGVGRSGTFITIDTCIQQLETTGLVDVKGVVERLRHQRHLSIQTKGQYVFCYRSVLEYAASCGLLDGENLTGISFSDQ